MGLRRAERGGSGTQSIREERLHSLALAKEDVSTDEDLKVESDAKEEERGEGSLALNIVTP